MNKDAAPEAWFSNSYREGRMRFIKACEEAGLAVRSFVHPELRGPDGEDLAMDSVWIGPSDAKKVLLVSCGVHGLEAATGSAAILKWIETDGPSAIPGDAAVLLVHAVNPFGWAYASRGNEDRVDLNRNCIDHAAPRPENPAYRDLHPHVAAANPDAAGLDAFIAAFHELARDKGLGHAITGVTAGQYEFADGLSFGGVAQSWSVRTLYEIARRYLTRAEKVFHIDWHTGIGDYGDPYFILEAQKDSAAHELAAAWWPGRNMHVDGVVEGLNPDYRGLIAAGLQAEIASLNQAQTVGLVIEWGTYDVEQMIQALVMDNWLRNRAEGAAPELIADVRARLIDRFYPADPKWRRSVAEKSAHLMDEALAGLADW